MVRHSWQHLLQSQAVVAMRCHLVQPRSVSEGNVRDILFGQIKLHGRQLLSLSCHDQAAACVRRTQEACSEVKVDTASSRSRQATRLSVEPPNSGIGGSCNCLFLSITMIGLRLMAQPTLVGRHKERPAGTVAHGLTVALSLRSSQSKHPRIRLAIWLETKDTVQMSKSINVRIFDKGVVAVVGRRHSERMESRPPYIPRVRPRLLATPQIASTKPWYSVACLLSSTFHRSFRLPSSAFATGYLNVSYSLSSCSWLCQSRPAVPSVFDASVQSRTDGHRPPHPHGREFITPTLNHFLHQLVLWCSWLSLLSNTQAVLSSSLSGIILLLFCSIPPVSTREFTVLES
jgi:hypothetical protein